MQSRTLNGVTLVELMVVMLIIVILTVAMTPLLSQFVVKAKYAAEAIPTVGFLLSALQATAVESSSSSNRAPPVSAAPADSLSDICKATFALQPRGGYAALNDVTGDVFDGPTNATFAGWIQAHASELDGRNFSATDYQIRIEHWDPEARAFLFSVAAVGGDRKGAAPNGTGHARLVADFESKGRRRQFEATWERYSTRGARRCGRLRLRGGDTNDCSRLDAIVVPGFEALSTSDDPGRLLLDLGWK